MNNISDKKSALKFSKILIILVCLFLIGGFSYVATKLIQSNGNDYADSELLGDDSAFDWSMTNVPSSITLTINETYKISPNADIPEGTTITSNSMSYSGGGSVASVSNSGVITGLAVGTTVVTVTGEINGVTKTANCTVIVTSGTTVIKTLTNLTLDPTSVTLSAIDQTTVLKAIATFSDGNSNEVSTGITWTTSDEYVAKVATGVVTAVYTGNATITASYTYGGVTKSADCKVVVSLNQFNWNMNLVKSAVTVYPGTTSQIYIDADIPEGTEITSRSLTYESGNNSVAAVSSSGLITGVSQGETEIYVTGMINGVYKTVNCYVTVNTLGEIIVDHEKLWLAKDGDSEDVTVSVTDSSGNSVEGLELEITGNIYTEVEIDDYVLTTKSLSIGEVTDTIKICVKGTETCTNYQAYIYCQKWTLVNSQRTFSLGYNLHDSHLNETCYYRDIDENSCEPIYTEDNVLKSYKCQSYYNRCCGTVTPPVEEPACYVNSSTNDYKWATTSPGEGYTIDSNITSESACKKPVEPTYACYVNSSTNDYKWSTTSPGEGYTIDSSITSESACKKPVEPTYACYVNSSTNDYKWSTTSPGEGYTIDSSITSESACKKPVEPTYACYVNSSTNDYKWSTTSPGEGYTIDSSITSQSACITPELPACYKDASNNYVWGLYYNDTNYTLVENILSEEDCHEKIDVPMTSSNVQNIIYVFVAILLTFGIYVIYYSYKKRKLNK